MPFFNSADVMWWSTCCWSTFWFASCTWLDHVLVCELHLAVQVLQPSHLTKADELVVDEAILDIVELVHVLHNGLTLILYKVLDKSISANGNPSPI